MKKIIRLTESELVNHIKFILSEDEVQLDVIGNNPPPEVIDNITCIQKALKRAGFGDLLGKTGPNGDGIDGVYGNRTSNVIKQFQKKNGIKQTGFVGPLTAPLLGCKPLKSKNKQETQPKKTEPVKPEPKSSTTCPSVGSSPYFRDLEEWVKENAKKYPNLKTRQDIINFFDRLIGRDSASYMNNKLINQKVACEVASIGRRPKYNDKYVFIIDSPNKRIFLYGKENGKTVRSLIAQDIIIDGKAKQRNDALSVAKSFETYAERFFQLKEKLKRNPTDDEVWETFDKDKMTFMPAGIYQGLNISDDEHYAGKGQNLLTLKNWMGKEVGQAIHGYYTGDKRVPYIEKALNIVKNPNDLKQIEEFTNQIKNKGLKMDWSYGCINLPPRFLPYLRKYGPNSFIFNIAEDTDNYLVQNTENYFDKMLNNKDCFSPESLGGENVA